MADKNTRQRQYDALARRRELAAYAVVGAARAIFNAYPISERLAKVGMDALKEFDRANEAVKKFNEEDRNDVANHTQRRAG